MASSKKKYIIFAGVNGSGKSTLFNLHPEYKSMPRVNVDELVRKHGTWNDVSAQIKAGKEAIALLSHYLESGTSFNQETTLCGHSILKNIEKARNNGFEIEIHYIGVESPEICKDRIKHRVSTGGHGIPDTDVERRYTESLKNIGNVLDICNKVYFYDNTEEFTLVAIYQNNTMDIRTQVIPVWFKQYLMNASQN